MLGEITLSEGFSVEMNVSSLGDRLVKVSLVGRLDTPGVSSVETRFVAHLVPGGNSAIVDLSQVDFVASMGLRMLVATAKDLKARQATLALYGAQRPVLQVFRGRGIEQDLSAITLIAFGTGLLLWLLYRYARKSWPLVLSNAVTLGLLCLLIALKAGLRDRPSHHRDAQPEQS